MDWKLTDEELRDTSKVAADKWLEQPPATSDEAGWVQAIDEAQRSLTLAVRRAIADAAVRKVVEWLEKENASDLYVSTREVPSWISKGDLFVIRMDWQALKQEVGYDTDIRG